ncbi:MAG: phosphatase PAP2 family protein [bacterium]|jgi:undecaprenyl-diphosphatase|nr:phosphatase PAP2 family protein [bacterium]
MIMSAVIKSLAAYEKRLFLLFNNRMRCRLLDSFFARMTHSGGAFITIALSVGTLVAGLATRQQIIIDIGIRSSASLGSSFAMVQIIKRLVNRPRPALKLSEIRVFDVPICAYSFPSGHTTASFAIAMTCALAHPLLVLPSIIWAGSVGLSRIYLGVHYPSDVLVGSIIGTAAAVLAQAHVII